MICEALNVEPLPQIKQYKKLLLGDRVILYGSMIKNGYDHDRINLNNTYKPIRVNIEGDCFYGVEIKASRHFNDVLDKIISVPFNHPEHVDMYRKRLKMYGYSCDTCWKFLKRKIFPIDGVNIQKIAINSPYNTMNSQSITTIKESQPWFTQYTDFKIFILNNK